jgi:hypothetical protein
VILLTRSKSGGFYSQSEAATELEGRKPWSQLSRDNPFTSLRPSQFLATGYRVGMVGRSAGSREGEQDCALVSAAAQQDGIRAGSGSKVEWKLSSSIYRVPTSCQALSAMHLLSHLILLLFINLHFIDEENNLKEMKALS